MQFVGEVFEKKEIPEEMNKSLICLLPKQVQPEHISNVVIKIFTKVIANRIEPVINDLIGVEQACFIPGWHTIDYIVVEQEALHSLRKK